MPVARSGSQHWRQPSHSVPAPTANRSTLTLSPRSPILRPTAERESKPLAPEGWETCAVRKINLYATMTPCHTGETIATDPFVRETGCAAPGSTLTATYERVSAKPQTIAQTPVTGP